MELSCSAFSLVMCALYERYLTIKLISLIYLWLLNLPKEYILVIGRAVAHRIRAIFVIIHFYN